MSIKISFLRADKGHPFYESMEWDGMDDDGMGVVGIGIFIIRFIDNDIPWT